MYADHIMALIFHKCYTQFCPQWEYKEKSVEEKKRSRSLSSSSWSNVNVNFERKKVGPVEYTERLSCTVREGACWVAASRVFSLSGRGSQRTIRGKRRRRCSGLCSCWSLLSNLMPAQQDNNSCPVTKDVVWPHSLRDNSKCSLLVVAQHTRLSIIKDSRLYSKSLHSF